MFCWVWSLEQFLFTNLAIRLCLASRVTFYWPNQSGYECSDQVVFLVGSFKRVQCLGSYLLFGWRVGRELIHLFLDVVCYVVRASFGRSFFPGPYSSIWVHCTLWWPQNQYIVQQKAVGEVSKRKSMERWVVVNHARTAQTCYPYLYLSVSLCIYIYAKKFAKVRKNKN